MKQFCYFTNNPQGDIIRYSTGRYCGMIYNKNGLPPTFFTGSKKSVKRRFWQSMKDKGIIFPHVDKGVNVGKITRC